MASELASERGRADTEDIRRIDPVLAERRSKETPIMRSRILPAAGERNEAPG
jgi:hypothetical protein